MWHKLAVLFITVFLLGNGPIERKPNCEFTEVIYLHFTVCFNQEWNVPHWVYYELTKEEAENRITDRKNRFYAEPKIEDSPNHSDYTHSGYDRGHLAPAADMSFSEQAMLDSFFMTNIAPQTPELNRKYWLELERHARKLAREYGSILVYTGAFTLHSPSSVLNDKVSVPFYFYKMVTYKGVCDGYVMSNHSPKSFEESMVDCGFLEYILNFELEVSNESD